MYLTRDSDLLIFFFSFRGSRLSPKSQRAPTLTLLGNLGAGVSYHPPGRGAKLTAISSTWMNRILWEALSKSGYAMLRSPSIVLSV